MRYAWDPEKYAANLSKHGVAFEVIEQADWSSAFTLTDTRFDYGETRMLAYVMIGKRLHAVLYVKRGDVRRIISLRKANLRERKAYEKAFKNQA